MKSKAFVKRNLGSPPLMSLLLYTIIPQLNCLQSISMTRLIFILKPQISVILLAYLLTNTWVEAVQQDSLTSMSQVSMKEDRGLGRGRMWILLLIFPLSKKTFLLGSTQVSILFKMNLQPPDKALTPRIPTWIHYKTTNARVSTKPKCLCLLGCHPDDNSQISLKITLILSDRVANILDTNSSHMINQG